MMSTNLQPSNLLVRGAPLVLVLAFALVTVHFAASPAAACSCAGLTPAQAFERADSVFVGEVTSFRVKSGLFGQSSIDPTTVDFTVMEVWKGPQQRTLTIRTVRSEVSCGYDFVEGLRYLVYARDGQTGLCDRTALTNQAADDLASLGEGWKPGPAPDTTSGSSGDDPAGIGSPRGSNGCGASSAPTAADAAVLGLLAGAVVLSIRRRPRI
jgi:MYXO-CTERM domain-containing protein